jgi:hypothetical protein
VVIMRLCLTCGEKIAVQSTGQPRKHCAKCRPPRNRPRPVQETIPAPPESLAAQIRADLESAGVVGTPAGLLAVSLATVVDEGGHTASGLAALSREIRQAVGDAKSSATTSATKISELREKRAARRAATG